MNERSELTGHTVNLEHKYRVGPPVRRGTMSTLYSATWDLFDLPVHVRSYEGLARIRLRHRDTTRIRWAVESDAGKLRGPFIPDIIDAGIEGPTNPFLVLRLPEGDLLSNVLDSGQRLSGEQTARVVACVAEALTAYRDAAATHRGPTVDRVWLAENGDAYLLGIGDVLYRDDTVSMSTAPTTELLWHIPPESFTQSQRPPTADAASSSPLRLRGRDKRGSLQGRKLEDDPRAEVYTLGCLAYQCLNGHHPFFTAMDDATEGIQATVSDAPLELRDHEPHSDLWRVISQALSKEPAERFADPLAFSEALSTAVGRPSVGAVPLAENIDTDTSADLPPYLATEQSDVFDTRPQETDTFQLWGWRFTAAVLAGLVAFLLVSDRFVSQTLLITSEPPGIEIGEEFGHIRRSLGATPLVLFDRDTATPLRIYTIGPDGAEGETAHYDVNRFQDLGHCRATELQLAYPEQVGTPDTAPAATPTVAPTAE